MSDNDITVFGNLTEDPELKFTPSGKAVVNFTLAQSKRKRNRETDQWEDDYVNFFRCTAWEGMAENIATTGRKGQRWFVKGETKTETFPDKNTGEKRFSTNNIVVGDCGPSMKWDAYDHKPRQGGGQQRQGGQQGGGYGGGNQQGGYGQRGGGYGGGQQQGGGFGGQQGGAPQSDPWSSGGQQGGFGGGNDDEPPF